MAKKAPVSIKTDALLIGAGIMSATLATIIKELRPELRVNIVERLDEPALESSDAWNNAGTGHSALCELNYTPQKADGSVDIKKAIKIYEQFEQSKEFWSYLIEKGNLGNAKDFINQVPHISFVKGEKDVQFLRTRYDLLSKHHFFEKMIYTEDPNTIEKWAPLIMKGRDKNEPVAATFADWGTDVNFGELTRAMLKRLDDMENFKMKMAHDVEDIKRMPNNFWKVKVKNITTGEVFYYTTPFIFIGAGGASLLLLEKSGIPEGKHYGGFPVGGQWLKCTNDNIIHQHNAKVYGKAAVGAPPMSVPHLDTRYVDGGRALLFGPYAGFSSKFLKHGSYSDLIASINFKNMIPMLQAGWDNLDLTKYLIGQVTQSQDKRVEALKEYFPQAVGSDWKLEIAGQRVQVIKKDPKTGGVLEFGTEIVSAADGSLAALLGASPGASTAASIMLELLNRCFPLQISNDNIQAKLKEMFPTYGISLSENPELFWDIHNHTNKVLEIKNA